MKKILIIDDEPDIVRVVKFRMIKNGYEVHVAVNGQEGLEMVSKLKPDLVLLDISMPLMKGDEVCKRIKSDPAVKDIPVIIMTAGTKGVQESFIKEIGAADSVLKPFDPDDMMNKIKKLIE